MQRLSQKHLGNMSYHKEGKNNLGTRFHHWQTHLMTMMRTLPFRGDGVTTLHTLQASEDEGAIDNVDNHSEAGEQPIEVRV